MLLSLLNAFWHHRSIQSLANVRGSALIVLNAFRHHRSIQAPTFVRFTSCERAQRLSASEINSELHRRMCRQTSVSTPFSIIDQFREPYAYHQRCRVVLNAFRHHRSIQGRIQVPTCARIGVCSTPFGIIDQFSCHDCSIVSHVASQCSTPCGIRDQFRANDWLKSDTGLNRAQRLSAS